MKYRIKQQLSYEERKLLKKLVSEKKKAQYNRDKRLKLPKLWS